MRNLFVVVLAYCALLMAGCVAPCSGCGHCSPTTTCGTNVYVVEAMPACSHIECPIRSNGGCATTGTPECAATPDACDVAAPACDSPTLAGGGHCGQSGNCKSGSSCANQVLLDWQQSTGVDEVICSEPACAAPCETEPVSCAAPANCVDCICGTAHPGGPVTKSGACTCPGGCRSNPNCTCSTGAVNCGCSNGRACTCQAVSQPAVTGSAPGTVSENWISAPNALPDPPVDQLSIPAPLELEPAPAAPFQSTAPEPVPTPETLTPSAPTEATPSAPAEATPAAPAASAPARLPRSVEGIPVEGYPGRGCPVHRTVTSPEKPDVSSTQPRRLPGVRKNQIRNSPSRVHHASRQVTSRRPKSASLKTTTKRKTASDSPFDWQPKPRVKIESNGWKSSSHPIKHSAPVASPPKAQPPTNVELPLPE